MIEQDIYTTIIRYQQRFPDDVHVVEQLKAFLDRSIDVTSRKEYRGHVTCGGVVVQSDGRFLMINHRALNIWLFPGGHLEPEDTTLRAAAIREVTEETGIRKSSLLNFDNWLDDVPIHVDCHPIPANPAKSEELHQHFDFRFVFRVDVIEISLQEEEVADWSWVNPRQMPKIVSKRIQEYISA